LTSIYSLTFQARTPLEPMCDPPAFGSTLSTFAMTSKWQFCRQKYTQAAAYEKHLQTTQANMHIILTSPLLYHIHHPRAIFLTRKPTSSENAWIPTMNPIPSVLDARTMYSVLMLCTSLILKCITTLRYFPVANKCFLWTLEKQLET